MIKNNYHTHAYYCNHAKGTVEDYVKAAYDFGFEEIGMTDHAPILESFMTEKEYKHNWCHENMKMDIVPEYLSAINECKEKYKGKIKVYSGFETEFIPEHLEFYKKLRNMVDYLNLGIHYFKDKNGKIINCYSEIDYKNVGEYADTCISGMESGIFNVLVHPDLFMFGYKNKNGLREFDEEAIKASRRIIESAINNNIYLEVNANGLKNSSIYGGDENNWLYPFKRFWLLAKEYKDLKIIIGADAHEPSHLANENVKKVCDFAKDINLNILDKMEINY